MQHLAKIIYQKVYFKSTGNIKLPSFSWWPLLIEIVKLDRGRKEIRLQLSQTLSC